MPWISPAALLSLAGLLGYSVAFQSLALVPHRHRAPTPTTLSSTSYLDSLSGSEQALSSGQLPHVHPDAGVQERSPGSYLDSLSGGGIQESNPIAPPSSPEVSSNGAHYLDSLSGSEIVQASSPNPLRTSSPGPITRPIDGMQSVEETAVPSTPQMQHVPLSYFDLDKLTLKGYRSTADWGQPQDATRSLATDGALRAGSWWCSEGGWPSPNPKAHTEIFFMIEGHGCLTDSDGLRHYFGPGDTVIIPKGHTGRWDVFDDIHKVWAVNDHAYVAEDDSRPIHVVVEHYNHYFDESLFEFEHVGAAKSRTLYDRDPTQVGVWTCPPGSISASKPKRSFFHMLEGVMYLTDEDGHTAKRCVAGDTVMLPEWWTGHMEIIETAKTLWVEVE